MLITEAKYAQISCDFLPQFKKPFKTLGAIIIPIVAFVAKKISEATTLTKMLNMAVLTIILILLIFLLICSFVAIVKYIFYIDYNRYDEFIYDLRQIKLFYSKTNHLITLPLTQKEFKDLSRDEILKKRIKYLKENNLL